MRRDSTSTPKDAMQEQPPRLAYEHRSGPPLLGSTIGDYLDTIAAQFPDRDAIVSIPEARRLSYRDLHRQVDELARALLSLGIQRGERVGIWSTNNVEWVLLQLATARVGAILVNINPANRVGELEHALRKARVQALFSIPRFRSSDYLAMVDELCPEAARQAPDQLRTERLPELTKLVVYDPTSPGATTRPKPGYFTLEEVLHRGRGRSPEEVRRRAASLDPDDPINIQFTSGTTGFPKAVVLTHHNLLNNGYFTAKVMRFTENDRLCVPVPFYHCFGMVVANLACLSAGAAVIIPAEHFSAEATLAAIEKERCTAVHGVPTMFVAALEHPDFHRFDLASLRTGIMAGAPCPPELIRRVLDNMGCREILVGYGQTEASPITHLTHPDDTFDRRVNTVGVNLPHQEVKIVDPQTGRMLRVGEQGEPCFRGYHVMRGYFGDEDATRAAIDEAGWLHSGDLGVMDDDGYLRLTGRLKDMIIRGGENVYPAEIEALLFEHPKVAEVAVFGLPDARMGEEIGAWIQLHEGATAEPEEFREYARGRIAHFKIPRYVWIVDEFPMTVTGKIQKFRIQEIVANELNE